MKMTVRDGGGLGCKRVGSHCRRWLLLFTALPVALPHRACRTRVVMAQEENVGGAKLDLLQGTLDLIVLQTLMTMGSLHGYEIARRIEQVSGDEVLLNQGTIHALLVRLQQRGWIAAEWGISDNNCKAKYYTIPRDGRRAAGEGRGLLASAFERNGMCADDGERGGAVMGAIGESIERVRSFFAKQECNGELDAELQRIWSLQ